MRRGATLAGMGALDWLPEVLAVIMLVGGAVLCAVMVLALAGAVLAVSVLVITRLTGLVRLAAKLLRGAAQELARPRG